MLSVGRTPEIPQTAPAGPSGVEPDNLTSAPESPVFQCRICGQVFTNQADLSEHMAQAHGLGGGKNGETPAGVA